MPNSNLSHIKMNYLLPIPLFAAVHNFAFAKKKNRRNNWAIETYVCGAQCAIRTTNVTWSVWVKMLIQFVGVVFIDAFCLSEYQQCVVDIFILAFKQNILPIKCAMHGEMICSGSNVINIKNHTQATSSQ